MPSGIGIAVIVLLVLIAGLVIYFGGLVGVLIMLGVLIVGVVVLFIVGRKMQRKQEDSESTMREGAQLTSMFVIEKKRCKLKESGLPAIMIEQTPKLLRNSKVSTVRAKVGPKFWTFMCDEKAYALIPEKKEVKSKSPCDGCPYGRVSPCIGYCLREIQQRGVRK